mmetsp:Transcript_17134/g.35808  ORF Transcript_17134/g.35808 Transcript_17134/m.35808 type:complete len:119 (+) Transcript_17134:205-561(+)
MLFLVFVVSLINALGFVIVTGTYVFVSFTDASGFLGVALSWVLGFFIVTFMDSFGSVFFAALPGFIVERYEFFIGSFLVLFFVDDAKLAVSFGYVGVYTCGRCCAEPGYAVQRWRQER